MAVPENGEENKSKEARAKGKKGKILMALRLTAFMATLAAAIVMGLNKQTHTFLVATIATTPLNASFSAHFHHSPAFVFFVVANAMVSFHNLVMMAIQIFFPKLECNALPLLSFAVLDMLNAALVAGATNAAAFMAEVGKNGNKHAKWNKICDRFQTYCDHSSGALIAAFAGLFLMLFISSISISRLSHP